MLGITTRGSRSKLFRRFRTHQVQAHGMMARRGNPTEQENSTTMVMVKNKTVLPNVAGLRARLRALDDSG